MPTDAEATQENNQQAQDTPTDASQEQQAQEFVFDAWMDEQPEHVRNGFEEHVRGLKSALQSERGGREKLEKQIRALGKQADEGSELKGELEKLGSELSEERVKGQFYLAAHDAKVTNVRLAWLAAKDADLIDTRGNVDFEALRQSNPELFAQPKVVAPPAHQGNGTGQEGVRKVGMNELIRQKAGRPAY